MLLYVCLVSLVNSVVDPHFLFPVAPTLKHRVSVKRFVFFLQFF
jgi:hypothetical protein